MLKDDYAATIAHAFHRTSYGRWLAEEGVATFEDWAVQDVWKLETAPWPRMGVNACFINLYALMEGRRGLFVGDIPPGGTTDPIHHLYEEMILILDGHGTTEIWQHGERRKYVFEWGRGSVFSPPLNTWFRLYNLSNQPARFLAFNRAPSAMNEFNEPEFVLDCPYAFRKRFSGQDDYFSVGERRAGRHESSSGEINNNLWESNFIPDAFSTDLHPQEDKVISGRRAGLRMAGNLMMGHIMEWPVGHYQKAHYHDAGAALLGLRSEGYVLMWPRAAGNQPYSSGHSDQVVEIRWGFGSIYAPPGEWFHQHFNSGKEPARNFAVYGGSGYSAAPLGREAAGGTNVNTRETWEGGTMLAWEDEDPEIRRRYREALAANGVESGMPDELYAKDYTQAHC